MLPLTADVVGFLSHPAMRYCSGLSHCIHTGPVDLLYSAVYSGPESAHFHVHLRCAMQVAVLPKALCDA